MKTTFQHMTQFGNIQKRTSDRLYSHVVVVTEGDGDGVWRWSASHAQAVSYAASLQKKGFDALCEEINNGARS